MWCVLPGVGAANRAGNEARNLLGSWSDGGSRLPWSRPIQRSDRHGVPSPPEAQGRRARRGTSRAPRSPIAHRGQRANEANYGLTAARAFWTARCRPRALGAVEHEGQLALLGRGDASNRAVPAAGGVRFWWKSDTRGSHQGILRGGGDSLIHQLLLESGVDAWIFSAAWGWAPAPGMASRIWWKARTRAPMVQG